MQTKKIIFRCDGGKSIGFGHLKRCLSLAKEFSSYHSAQVFFAIKGDASAIDIVRNEGYQVLSNLSSSELEWNSSLIKIKADAIFFDVRDQTSRHELHVLKKSGIKIVVLDDSSDRRLSADYVFYPPVPQIEKLNWSEFKGKKYVGWEWVFLSQDFYSTEIPSDSNFFLKKNKLIITMGGVDAPDLSYQILSILKTINFEGEIILVLGSGYQGLVNEEMLKGYVNIKLVRTPKSMKEIMQQASFAICAFGVTAYELAAIGVPSLLICNSEDDQLSAEIFRNEVKAQLINSKNLNIFEVKESMKCLMYSKFPEDKNLNIGSGLKKVHKILWP